MKIITTIICFFFINSALFAQLEKGDWLLDFQLKTNSEFTQLSSGRRFFNSENLQLKCGRFLSDGFVAGLRYSLIKEGNQQVLEPFGNVDFSLEEHQFGTFLRYYFGRKSEKKLLFVKGDWTWSYTDFQHTREENSFLKQLNFDVGMGLSLFQFPNAAIEMWLDYNLLEISGNAIVENSSFGQSRLIFYTQFQIYLNQSFQSKWKHESKPFLQAGKSIISGNIKYDGINSGFFTRRTTIEVNLAYGKFISPRWLLGGTTPIKLEFVDKQVDFDVAFGPFSRYYQPLTERLQLFGHLEFTTNIVGLNYIFSRPIITGEWQITEAFETTLGLGMNLFLNKELSAFWLYKYTVPQDFSSIDLEIWNARHSALTLDMGLAFWF